MTKFIIYSFVSALALSASAQAAQRDCPVKMNFDTRQTIENWRAVNDGVMGGLSSGGPIFENGHMIFAGVINTNGGGFSSVRTNLTPGLLSRASRVSLRVKSDGRAYRVTFRTNARYRFRPLSFEAVIPFTPKGEWASVNVEFEDLNASIFGRPVKGVQFDKSEVRELGIILADGQDGQFSLEVNSIKACTNP